MPTTPETPVLRCHVLDTGYCTASEHHLIQGGRRRRLIVHSVAALLQHPQHGWLLWDAGYAPRLLDAKEYMYLHPGMHFGFVDTLGRAFFPDLLRMVLSKDAASTAAPALSSMLIYLLMAIVLVVKPEGLFSAGQK